MHYSKYMYMYLYVYVYVIFTVPAYSHGNEGSHL